MLEKNSVTSPLRSDVSKRGDRWYGRRGKVSRFLSRQVGWDCQPAKRTNLTSHQKRGNGHSSPRWHAVSAEHMVFPDYFFHDNPATVTRLGAIHFVLTLQSRGAYKWWVNDVEQLCMAITKVSESIRPHREALGQSEGTAPLAPTVRPRRRMRVEPREQKPSSQP